MSTDEALCIKNTLTDQIGLGHLISKHEMFCFEKTVFKTFKLLLEYFLFFFILTALLNDVQTARVRTGLETHARHSPS